MFIAIVIFICIAFLYSHIRRELRTSNDAEMYDVDYTTAAGLEETADIGQPFVFQGEEIAPDVFAYASLSHILSATGGAFSVSLKDSADYYGAETNVPAISTPLRTATSIVSADVRSRFFSDTNADFIEESGAIKTIRKLDEFIRPRMVVQTIYDLLFGSHGTYTPLRYHTDHAQYIAVTRGALHIKFIPPNHGDSLHEIRDYENYEFRSRVNVWDPQEIYKGDMTTVRIIDSRIEAGSIVYIPARWWYSIKFIAEDGENVALSYTYNTITNKLANATHIMKYILQNANTTTPVVKKITTPDDKNVVEDGGEMKDNETKAPPSQRKTDEPIVL